MGDKQGWICLHRCIQYNSLWEEKPFDRARAWIDLILLANHEDNKTLYQGKIVVFKRGTVNRSITSLSERWGWDRKKTRNFLNLLESEQMVTTNRTTHGTTITIVNYGFYQDMGTTKRTTKGSTTPQPLPQPLPTNNNDNNDNNDKQKRRGTPSFEKPSLKEVRDYCKERNNHVDPQLFINFYESNGWMVGKNKMKDWKAAVRTWEQRIFEFKAKDSKRQYEFEQNTNYAELESKLLEN